jgi:ribosomal protein S18 acetylase RimI-like enzyme
MNQRLILRPARPEDAELAAVLLFSAYNHSQSTYPPSNLIIPGFQMAIRSHFSEPGNRFSYEYTLVVDISGIVAGLILNFGGRDEDRLNAALDWPLAREAQDDEWYIDALSVFSNWGGQGLGTRLVQMAEEQALQSGYTKIALSVAHENTQALALYQRLGYLMQQYGRAIQI